MNIVFINGVLHKNVKEIKNSIKLDDKYKDCEFEDFNKDLTFNVKKYEQRKLKELSNKSLY